MAYIGTQPLAGQYRKLDDISSGFNGATTSFTTSVGGTNVTAGSPQQLLVSLGGVIQQPTTDYTVNTSTIIFTTAPASGLSFFAILMGDALNTSVPADGSITSAKLAGSLSVGLAAGSASTPSLFFTGDLNTGIYSPGADQVAISTNGSGRLFVNSSGSVGIGTSSPAAPLHVSGTDDILRLTATDPYLSFYNGATRTGYIRSDATNSAFNIVSENATSAMRFYTNNTVRAVIDSSGRVGIGTSTPGEKLSIYDSTSNAFVSIQNGSTGTTGSDGSFIGVAGTSLQIGNRESASIDFYTANTERFRCDSSGRLLVGTSTSASTTANVVVQGSSNGQLELRCATDPSSSGTALGVLRFTNNSGGLFAQIYSESDGTISSSSDLPGRLVFSTTADGASSPTERMRISNSGHVFIGTTTEYPGEGNTATGFMLQNVGKIFASCSAGDQAGNFNKNGDGTLISMRRSGNSVGSISVTTTATAYNTSSDYRLKENVIAVSDGITRLQQLKPSRFNFIADPAKTVDGFIAHEVQAIVPEAITGTKDEVDDDGNPVYQGIDQSKLVPLLTAALQEAIGRIETLEAEVAALKAQ